VTHPFIPPARPLIGEEEIDAVAAVMRTGMTGVDGTWYYLDSAGHPSGSGWTWIDGSWYYLTGGRATLGWMANGGSWYYLDEQ